VFKKVLIIILFAIIGAVLLGGLYFWNQIGLPVSGNEEEVVFNIKDGESVKEIGVNLEAVELIRSAYWFEVYVFFDGSQSNFIAGDYLLGKDSNIKEVVDILTSGQVADEQVITIIEGWNSVEISDYLAEQGVVEKNDFLKAVATKDSRRLIPDKIYNLLVDKPAEQDLEGYLFPDTYRIYEDATSVDIIKKMLDNFEIKFTDQMKQDVEAGNMSIYEIITLASIIEKEVRTDTDRKIAAGIFYDRMNLGVALQSDATVNYVTGKQALQPSSEDLKVDNLYNTYKYKGLPPGPICNPALSAIMAAIYPEKSEYFYFLTKPDGSTVFSKTYDEHLENKRKYLQ